ncbi:hypothetical protein DFS34DRAFT_646957 [Phlyctochytrium arcticum]|nr:hypothetical protein DFS34DRAFT_646957 [Phlyctochytrium arcticum]
MVTDNPEQDPYEQLHDGLNKLRLQNNDLVAMVEKVQKENFELRKMTADLQAIVANKLTKDLHLTGATTKQPLLFPDKLDTLDRTHGFLFQIRYFIRLHPTCYPDNASQPDLLVSLLRGSALDFVADIMRLEMVELQSFSNLADTIEVISSRYVLEGLPWLKQEDGETVKEWSGKIERFDRFLSICRQYDPVWAGSVGCLPYQGRWTPEKAFDYGLKPEFHKQPSTKATMDQMLEAIKMNRG